MSARAQGLHRSRLHRERWRGGAGAAEPCALKGVITEIRANRDRLRDLDAMPDVARERLVCEAVVHVLEGRKGEPLSYVESPEIMDRNRQSVELIIRGAVDRYVLEHTRIESFPRQIEDDRLFVDLLQPLQEKLDKKMPPPGSYCLSVWPGTVRVGRSMVDSVQSALERWIREKAPQLKLGSPKTTPDHIATETPTGVPFKVQLQRWSGMDGMFRIGRFAPPDLQERRKVRVTSAIEAKCPKLQLAKQQHEATAVLILESKDIALGNFFDISKACLEGLAQRTDAPDYVFLVETDIPPNFCVWIVKEGTRMITATDEATRVPEPQPSYIAIGALNCERHRLNVR